MTVVLLTVLYDMAPWLRALDLFQRTSLQFPTPTWAVHNIYNSTYRGSNMLLASVGIRYPCGTHGIRRHSHKIKLTFKMLVISVCVCLGGGAHICGNRRLTQGVFPVILYLIFWDRVSKIVHWLADLSGHWALGYPPGLVSVSVVLDGIIDICHWICIHSLMLVW